MFGKGECKVLVVPRKTSYSPTHAHVGYPDLWSTKEDVEISVVFTWDKPKAENMKQAWESFGCNVTIGGPAYDDEGGEFTPNQYVRQGVTYTSRGCNRQCPWCYVPKREGKIRELKTIHPGNIVQDNNLLMCSRSHQEKVFEMLKGQHGIRFLGGIDARMLTDWHVEQFKGLRIAEIWLAADHADYWKWSERAIQKLSKNGFSRNKIRCFVMVGYDGETISYAEERLRNVYHAGALPFVQLYDQVVDKKPWKQFIRTWSRPAAINTVMKGVACYHVRQE
jgi:hypothetical protein